MKLSARRQSQALLQNLRQRRFQYEKNGKANHGDKGRQEQGPMVYVNGTAAAGIAEDVLVCAWRSAVLRRRVGG